MKTSLRKHLTKTLFLTLIVLIVINAPVMAAEILFVSPTRVHLNDKHKVGVMNVTNTSDITRHYTISMENIIMTPEGVTSEVENFEYSAKRMLRFVPRSVTLAPGERQTIRIQSRIGPDVPEGDYHVHIHFLEDATKREKPGVGADGKGAAIMAPLSYSTLIPIIVSHGTVTANLDMTDVKVQKAADGQKYSVSMMLHRSGNGQGTAHIETILTGSGKDSVPTPRRTAYIYRELDARKYAYEFPVSEATQGQKTIKIRLFDNASEKAGPVKEIDLPLP
ncbi:MAG: hypothetical protein KJ017_08210 [Alphaproteobacteria bacterium]|nr:hypothetical protein [Alphaproteobacteria bacterium]